MRVTFRVIAVFGLAAAGFVPAVTATAGTVPASAARITARGVSFQSGVIAGGRLSASSAPSGARLWVQRFTGGTGRSGRASGIAVSPDRPIVYVTGTTVKTSGAPAADCTTVAYDTLTGAPIWVARYQSALYHPYCSSIAVSPNGSRVFVAGVTGPGRFGNSVVLAYNAVTGALLWSAKSSLLGAGFLAVSPDSSEVFVSGTAGYRSGRYTTVAYSTATGGQVWTASTLVTQLQWIGVQVTSISVSPNGSELFVGGVNGIVAYDAHTGAMLWFDHYKSRWRRAPLLAASPDSSTVFVTSGRAGGNNTSHFLTTAYDAATGAQLWAASYYGPAGAGAAAVAIALSPDGSQVFVTGSSYQATCCKRHFETIAYNAASGAQLWAASYRAPGPNGASAQSIAIAPDGSKVFVTGAAQSSQTVAYDAATGAQLWAAHYQGLAPISMAVSRNGTRVFVTGSGPVSNYNEYLTVAYRA